MKMMQCKEVMTLQNKQPAVIDFLTAENAPLIDIHKQASPPSAVAGPAHLILYSFAPPTSGKEYKL
jgi:hypothetical protein